MCAYRTTWQPAAAPDVIAVTASVARAGALSALAPDAIFSPLVDFAALGAHGGLSFSGHDPAKAQASVAQTRIVGDEVEWVLEVAGVAPRCLKLLEGALAFFDSRLAPLHAVTVAAPASLLAQRASDPGGHFLPAPFAVTDERRRLGRGYSIELRFAEEQPEEIFDRVEAVFWSWFAAASVGCFIDATYTPSLSHVYLDLDDIKYHPGYVVIPIEEALLAEPDSRDCLIDVFQWLHHHVVALASVDFYD